MLRFGDEGSDGDGIDDGEPGAPPDAGLTLPADGTDRHAHGQAAPHEARFRYGAIDDTTLELRDIVEIGPGSAGGAGGVHRVGSTPERRRQGFTPPHGTERWFGSRLVLDGRPLPASYDVCPRE